MPIPIEEIDKATTPCFSTLANKLGVTPRKLLQEIKLIAFSDPANHAEIAEGGELRFKTFEEQGRKRRAIKKIKEKTVITESKDGEKIYKTSTVEYELHSKMDAIDMGLAIHGMKKPTNVKVDHAGKVIVEIVKFSDGDGTEGTDTK
jgi:hypothetical protein